MRASSKTSSVKDFLRLADIGRSRSSILNPLQWTMVILIAAIVALQFAHAPSWLSILFATLLVLDMALFFIAYFYFMRQRPHSLRSESFDYKMSELIQRRAGEMEAGLYEEVSAVSELKVHAAADSQQLEEQNDK
jgi:Flp pilus assembly protein TadB